jgi:hypothetical protein
MQSRLGGYDAWKVGYRTTTSINVSDVRTTSVAADHAKVALNLESVDADACAHDVTQRFSGVWTLTRRNGRWSADDILMTRTSGASPALTAANCPKTTAAPHSTAAAGAADQGTTVRACYPSTHLAAVHLPAVNIPTRTIPGFTLGSQYYPPTHTAAVRIPSSTIPASTIPGGCFNVPSSFALQSTTVRESGYDQLDPQYSPRLSAAYWSANPAVSTPDPTATGFGELNGAGYPKNQYVRPYVRSDGTQVSGYWRNSPNDGLPTCHVISC